MAAGGLLALLDDIAAVLDDVAVMSKVAIKKTAGIAGDDLAVGASTVTGADPARELPVVWAVAKGSFINKLYLVPGALLLNAVAPFLIKPILMAGGVFFCYEGVEKILHARSKKDDKKATAAFVEGEAALLEFEKQKIRSAIKTDLVLSAEIVAVTLGVVASSPFSTQLAVLSAIALLMTVGIYGLVAGIVKLDDLGFHLSKKRSPAAKRFGILLVQAAPKVMKALSVIGTAAMLLVGGELILHGIPATAHALHEVSGFVSAAASAIMGLIIGFIAIPVWNFCSAAAKKVLSIKSHKKRGKKTS